MTCESHNKTVVACQIGNPFKNGSEIKFQIKFDVKQIENSETKLNFMAFTNTTSLDENRSDPIKIVIAVVKKAEVSLKGYLFFSVVKNLQTIFFHPRSARPEQVFYGGAVRGESAMVFKDDIGTKVVHTYLAYNAGPWRVRDLEVIISWPFQIANNKPQGKWLLYLDEMPIVEGKFPYLIF